MDESRTTEMESLNLETMDIEELEHRLELALAGGGDPIDSAWSCCVNGGGSSCGALTEC